MHMQTLKVGGLVWIAVALVAGALLFALQGASSAQAADCGNSFIKGGRSGGAALGIETKSVGCGKARQVVKQYSYLRGCPKGWSCSNRRSSIKLKRSNKQITFEVVLTPIKQVRL